MQNATKERYFLTPVHLLRTLVTDKERTINNIIHYGLYRFAKEMQYDETEALRQSIYCYYRGGLSSRLKTFFNIFASQGVFSESDDFDGFHLGNFNPEIGIYELYSIMQEDNDFKDTVVDFYRIRQTFDFFGFNHSMETTIDIGTSIEATIPNNYPSTFINKGMLLDFLNKPKSEDELVQLAVYLSIKSLVGTKKYYKTTKDIIIKRAFGYSEKDKDCSDISPLFTKYQSRHHIDTLILKLKKNWGVIVYSQNMRGMYVSLAGKITKERLAQIAEENKMKNIVIADKLENANLKKQALEYLKNKHST